ncbi:sensor histidine kinase [Flavobacterium sp. W22_SRS_FP1]|uniref:sensor histidine kinase n=1 Tax=Flavobacterium sp. W22_SRS_FP1 TaxID=3240276 RepID=UPI003F92D7D7
MKDSFLGFAIVNNAVLEKSILDDALELCVSILCNTLSMDQCYIYNCKLEKIPNRHVNKIKNDKDFSDNENLEKKLKNLFSQKKETFNLGQLIRSDTEESEHLPLREMMRSRNIETYFLFPIISNDKPWGFIGFEKSQKIHWSTAEVKSVELLSKNIGIRIYKDSIVDSLGAQLENLNYYMNGTNQAMWELDLTTYTPTYSYSCAEMIGYELNEVEQTYKFWRSNTHPEDAALLEKNLADYLANISNKFTGLLRMKHKEGHWVWIRYSGLVMRGNHGPLKKMIGTNIDVTSLKEKEIQLQSSEEKYKFITENSSDIICQHDKYGKYIYISKSYTTILGYEISEMINKNAFDYIHPDDIIMVSAAHKKYIETNKHEVLTYRFRTRDNAYVWLETTSKSIIDNENNVIGLQTCSRNVSERIKATLKEKINFDKEKELTQMKSDFVVMASHQFRTPLTVIYSNTELLELKTSNLEKETTLLIEPITARIKKEVDRMTGLMNNILVFAKYKSQKTKIEIKTIDLDILTTRLKETYFSSNSDERTLRVTTKGEKRTICSNELLLIQILTNLIDNAFKYSIGKTNPSLKIIYLQNEVQIELVDHGVGVPEDEIKQLFTSFFRASNTNTIQGSGLGLSIVKEFTSLLNGTITLKTKENLGTTIKLKFPYE